MLLGPVSRTDKAGIFVGNAADEHRATRQPSSSHLLIRQPLNGSPWWAGVIAIWRIYCWQ
jgi:hypothetical protein